MANIDVMYSSKTDQWATPEDFFEELDKEFHFDLDPCADETNHKCEHYFTKEQNGLKPDWGGASRLLQSTIRQSDHRLGGKVLQGRNERQHDRCYAYTSKNRHTILPRLYTAQIRSQICQRSPEVRKQ